MRERPQPLQTLVVKSNIGAVLGAGLVVAVLLGVTLPSAQAETVVSNRNRGDTFSPSTGATFVQNVFFAGKFTTGDSPAIISSVTLISSTGEQVALYDLWLYSDAGAVPGTYLGEFDRYDDNPMGTYASLLPNKTNEPVFFESTAGLYVEANTSYWLALRNFSGNLISWQSTNSDDQTSSVGWTISDTGIASSQNFGVSWVDSSPSYAPYVPIFSIEAQLVPEPHAALLVLAGCAGLVVFRRRK